MGTKLKPGKFDCYLAAMPDEPLFTFTGRDRLAAPLTNIWALVRAGNLKEARIAFDEMVRVSGSYYVLNPDGEKPADAIECAIAMAYYREEREKAKARCSEIDAEFEAATGWGSWMVTVANEREDLATRFGLPQKHQARTGSGRRTD